MFQVITLASVAVLVGLDQWTKWLATVYLKGQDPAVWWEGVFELRYHTNTGAAFGLLPHARTVLIVLTSLLVFAVVLLLLSGRLKRYPLAAVSAVLIGAGGAGNLIDRVVNGEVVDFLYVKLIDFPLFNVADCLVVIGAALLVFFMLFVYREKPSPAEKTDDPSLLSEETPADDPPAT